MNKRLIIVLLSTVVLVVFCFVINNTWSQKNEKKYEQRGNSLGNIGGFVGQTGDWIYYTSMYKSDTPWIEVFCRENVKTGKKEKICDEAIRNLNVLDQWIIFTISSPSGEGPIYRMKLDGSSKKRLNNAQSGFVNVVGEYIYYINFSDGFKINRMNLDGNNHMKLNEERSWCINVVGGHIFYVSGNDVYKMTIEGNEKEKIFSEDIGYMILNNNWIYYYIGDMGNLYKIKVNGTGKMLLTNDVTDNFNIAGNFIYYNQKINKKTYIYRIDLDGKNKIKISEGSVGSIVGNWIFSYEKYQEFQVPVRIKIDGTFKEKLHLK